MITALLSKVTPFLTALKGAVGFMAAAGGTGSLSSLTRNTRVEPVTLVDKLLVHQPWLADILQAVNSIFTAYYLQGVATLAECNGVKAGRILEPLNPARDAMSHAIGASMRLSSEAMLDPKSYMCGFPSIGMESATTPAEIADAASEAAKKDTYTINSKNYDSLSQSINLSVGRMFEVSLTRDGQTTKVPVMVRLIVSIIESDVMAHILGAAGKNINVLDRYHAWRANQLSFIRDIVFMQDLIDAHKATLAKDTTGAYKEVSKRGTGNTISAMASNTVSHATASNIAVISSRTAKMIESLTKKRFRDGQLIDIMFERGYLLILVVVDEEMERVTFYHRGVSIPTQLSLRELKASNKDSGPDVMEIYKSFMLGQQIRP